jgi:hypothetical protein
MQIELTGCNLDIANEHFHAASCALIRELDASVWFIIPRMFQNSEI